MNADFQIKKEGGSLFFDHQLFCWLSLIFLASLLAFFLGLLAPNVPRLIFPFLDFKSPFPISCSIGYVDREIKK
jgi:hypothetical protein